MDDTKRFAWLRFAVGEASGRGQGFCKDALRAVIAHLFQKGMTRVEAEVFEFNHPSLHLLEGLGFRREGLKRKAHFDGKKFWNVFVLGLLEGELR